MARRCRSLIVLGWEAPWDEIGIGFSVEAKHSGRSLKKAQFDDGTHPQSEGDGPPLAIEREISATRWRRAISGKGDGSGFQWRFEPAAVGSTSHAAAAHGAGAPSRGDGSGSGAILSHRYPLPEQKSPRLRR